MQNQPELSTYVFQGYDGRIYGESKRWTKQKASRSNAQNRLDGVLGRWMDVRDLTLAELARRADLNDLSGFKSPCCLCGGFPKRGAA